MAENFPDEIWILILGYVPLQDRLKNVQFVCKRLHLLCYDPLLNVTLNFTSSIFLSDRSCRKFINIVKEFVKSLSFRDCHWFSESLFSMLPLLPVLKTIDLTGCYLKGIGLHQLLKMMPSLEHLAISISGKELRNFIDECRKSKDESPKLCLRTLHIESYPGGISYTDLSSNIARLFFGESSKRPESFSVNWLLPVKSFAKMYMVPSRCTLDYECDLDLSTFDACRAFCTALLCANLHGPIIVNSDGVSNYLPRYNLSSIKFLSLPNVTSINWEYDTCNEAKCPSTLPNLECLISPIMNYREGSCYYALKHSLLMECSYPKLKCLKIIGECETIPVDFYSRISLLRNLTDLNLMGIRIDLELLSKSIRELKKLKSLSIFPFFNSGNISRPSDEVSAAYAQERLSLFEILPNLRRLEISQRSPIVSTMSSSCSKTLEGLGKFRNLQKLSLRSVGLVESYSKSLKECASLTSLCLSQCGKDDECIYPTLLEGVLRILPNLLELRLQHEMLQFKTKLFEEISECKRIEKVVLSNMTIDDSVMTTWFDDHLASPTYLGHFISLVRSNCPSLHVFVILANFSRHWCDRWEKYKSTLVSPDDHLIYECGHPSLITTSQNPVLYKLIDFTKSGIFDYNPFNFPYSNGDSFI